MLTFWTTSGQISIHAPRTGSDAELAFVAQLGKISIHAPRTGSDLALDIDDDVDFISIHAPRTGSDLTYSTSPAIRKISIHAPRTGSDTASLLATDGVITFQSTLPARGATSSFKCFPISGKFQSTLPARGATSWYGYYYAIDDYFNPRSPHGERPNLLQYSPEIERISIHAPRTGSDVLRGRHGSVIISFQSTLPARGATKPYSPSHGLSLVFQSTLPARGATFFPPGCPA